MLFIKFHLLYVIHYILFIICYLLNFIYYINNQKSMHVYFAVRIHARDPNIGMSKPWMVDALAGSALPG